MSFAANAFLHTEGTGRSRALAPGRVYNNLPGPPGKRHHGVHSLGCQARREHECLSTGLTLPSQQGSWRQPLLQEGYCLPGLDREAMPPPAPSAFWREKKDMVSMKGKGTCCVSGLVILMKKAIRSLRVGTRMSDVCPGTRTLPQVNPAPFPPPTQPLAHICEERVL